MTDKPSYELGPPRGAWGMPWKSHRSLGEIDRGVPPVAAEISNWRAGSIRLQKWLETTDKMDEPA